MRLLKHPLLLAILSVAAAYLVFAYGLEPPMPRSLLIQYMAIVSVGVLLVAGFDDTTARRFAAPVLSLLGDPRHRLARALAFVAAVAGAGWLSHALLRPDARAPLELRTVHPAPPARLRAYGRSYDLLTLTNPIRDRYEAGSEGFERAVAEGGEIYYRNCVYCHGDRLDGKGQFAEAFSPRPANFQDVGTIAQLQESYLFWRIVTGGPGLPREGTPWASAMPAWQEMLTEEEIWKVIAFLYDYTGHVPRSWELAPAAETPAAPPRPAPASAPASAPAPAPAPAPADPAGEVDVEAIYLKRCAQCHGVDGDGLGPAADRMYPRPRDFTLALFKYKSTDADSEFPSDADFFRTIGQGLPGTAMPGWEGMLSEAEIGALIGLIKAFGGWEEEEPDYAPVEMPAAMPAPTPELLARGRTQFVKACAQCHGDAGRGNVTSGKPLRDDLGERIWPRNLTRPETWRWTRSTADIYQRLSAGIPGTPMPEHATTMSAEDRWAIASYVAGLRDSAVPPSPGETVIEAVRVDGPLPSAPDDPAWEAAPVRSFPLAPNVIREPRVFATLNDRLSVRALYNDRDIAIRVDLDDRTYSVPGDALERAYALAEVTPTRDALAIQFPAELTGTSQKPHFRLGDSRHPVALWYWAAPSAEPEAPETAQILDARGAAQPLRPRQGDSGLSASGMWADGRWQVVFTRARETAQPGDIAFADGAFVPVAFIGWDGLSGQEGLRQSFTAWYWLRIAPATDPLGLYGLPGAVAALTGALFVWLARRARRRFSP